jgi:hypothetical protein
MNGTETPEPQAPGIHLSRKELYTWPVHDCKIKGDQAIPAWQLSVWLTCDVARFNGL